MATEVVLQNCQLDEKVQRVVAQMQTSGGKERARKAWSPDPWQSETPTPSEDSGEEGELLGFEEEDAEVIRDHRMLPIELFPRLVGKAMQTLKLSPQESELSTEEKQSGKRLNFCLPRVAARI